MEPENPFSSDKQYFANIPIEERPAWTRKMLQTEQKTGEYKIFREEYPKQSKWNYRGYDLNYNLNEKYNNKPKGLLFYFHGMNSYGGSSGYFANHLVNNCGLNAYAIDFTNFGQSDGPERGFIESFQQMVTEAEDFIKYIETKYEEKLPIVLSGLSLGGTICFKLSLRNPQKFRAIIFLAAALRENKQNKPFLKKVGKFLGTYFPKLKVVSQSFTEQTKYNQTERIEADPNIYKGKVVPGSVKVILQAMEQSEKQWEKFKDPFIFFQSGVDKMVDPFQALDFEKKVKSQDKTVIYCKDMWHGIFGEEEIATIVKIVAKWVNQRL